MKNSIENKVSRLLHKQNHSSKWGNIKLSPQYSKPIQRLPKIRKTSVPLRPMARSINQNLFFASRKFKCLLKKHLRFLETLSPILKEISSFVTSLRALTPTSGSYNQTNSKNCRILRCYSEMIPSGSPSNWLRSCGADLVDG